MKFQDLVMERYATKKFNGETISKEKVDKLLELIIYAPSSFNLQPWKIKIVTDQETKGKLSPLSWDQPQIKTCSHLLVFCADINIKTLIDKLENLMIKNGSKKESIAEYIGVMRSFEEGMSDEKKLSWAQRQLYIALGNAMNGAKELGFDSCPMEGFDSKGYKELLELDDNLVPTVLCPIGYADDESKPKIRFSKEEIIIA